MRKGILFSILAIFLTLGACSMKEEVENIKEPVQKASEKELKENENELTFEVNDEKKTVNATPKTLSSVGKEIKATENFEVNEDPNGIVMVEGKNTFDGMNMYIRPVQKIFSKANSKSIMIGLTGSKGPYEELDYPGLKQKYTVALTGESDTEKGVLLQMDGEKPYMVTIQLPKNASLNQEEVLAELVAILNTFKQ